MIYLDNAASTKMLNCALEAFVNANNELYANPSAVHEMGTTAARAIENARTEIKNVLGAKDKNIVFTSGGTESINTAIFGATRKNKHKGRHILSTKAEHTATNEVLKILTAEGYDVTYAPLKKDGSVDIDVLKNALRDDTILVTMTAVSSETGAILPYDEIFAYAKGKNKNIVTHLDAVQGFLKTDTKLKNCDFASFSGHKIGAPKGIGLLYIKDGNTVPPLLYGGYQDCGLRSGTQPTPLVLALASAVKYGAENCSSNVAKLSELRNYAVTKLSEMRHKCHIVTPQFCAPHILSVGFDYGKSEVLIRILSDDGVCVAGGSACAKGKKSSVLVAMGLAPCVIDSTLRISFCTQNTKDEIDFLIEKLEKALDMFK